MIPKALDQIALSDLKQLVTEGAREGAILSTNESFRQEGIKIRFISYGRSRRWQIQVVAM
jgi:hypothetical protein